MSPELSATLLGIVIGAAFSFIANFIFILRQERNERRKENKAIIESRLREIELLLNQIVEANNEVAVIASSICSNGINPRSEASLQRVKNLAEAIEKLNSLALRSSAILRLDILEDEDLKEKSKIFIRECASISEKLMEVSKVLRNGIDKELESVIMQWSVRTTSLENEIIAYLDDYRLGKHGFWWKLKRDVKRTYKKVSQRKPKKAEQN